MTNKKELSIIQMNDTHAYFDLHQELFWDGDKATYKKAGGYGRIATIMKNIRKEKNGNVLAFDCGDTVHGTYHAVQTKGEALIPILNELNFNAMTSHWEFAYGPEQLKKITEKLSYPMLAINCYDKETDELVYDPYKIEEVNGLKIGIVGIAATIVDKVMPKHFSEGIYFTLGNEELPDYISELKKDKGVDLIVVISHLGFPQEVKLSKEVDGIDVLLSAHTHNRVYEPAIINDTIIIQSGCHGSFLGLLELEIEDGKISSYNHKLITVGEEIEPDEKVQRLVDNVLELNKEELNKVVGYTKTALNRNTVLESTMDNLLLQSMLDVTGAQLAFSNGWRYGAPIIPGPITLNDLWNIIPVNPPISTVEITGKELWDMMEENLERTFARNPYKQMGGYVKRCMGLNLYFKIENPYGQRIQELFVNGEPVVMNQVYTACSVTTQGVPAKYGKNRKKTNTLAIEGLKRYLEKHDKVDAELRGTIVAV